jgi:hypothetical protein
MNICKSHGDTWEPGCEYCEIICRDLCGMSVSQWLNAKDRPGMAACTCQMCGERHVDPSGLISTMSYDELKAKESTRIDFE